MLSSQRKYSGLRGQGATPRLLPNGKLTESCQQAGLAVVRCGNVGLLLELRLRLSVPAAQFVRVPVVGDAGPVLVCFIPHVSPRSKVCNLSAERRQYVPSDIVSNVHHDFLHCTRHVQ